MAVITDHIFCPALIISFFTARVDSIIDKNEVNDWHNVRNGIFSVGDAEDIFDSYFDGKNVLRGMV